MQEANRFAVVNIVAKAIRKSHHPAKERLEVTLHRLVEQAEKFLLSGTEEEVNKKNRRGLFDPKKYKNEPKDRFAASPPESPATPPTSS